MSGSGTVERDGLGGEYGSPIRRIEDPPLLTGQGRYTDDLRLEGTAHAVFVRSDFAHARVGAIETSAASEAAGVLGVFSAADLDLEPMPAGTAPEGMARPVFASDTVRFSGEVVAVVVAETRALAVDAAELVEVEYDPLDVVVDPREALGADSPQLFPEHGSNIASESGEDGGSALDGADVVVHSHFVNQRVAAVPLEPSAALAAPDPETGGIILWAPVQAPFGARDAVAESLGLEKDKVRVIAPVVGGGFGARIAAYPEQVIVAALARKLDRPVRYVEGRSETMVSMQHGRAQLQEVELGAKSDGTLTGIKIHVLADCGAYPADAVEMPELTGMMASGVYRMPQVDYSMQCVVTNTTPIGAYRGAGRPEAAALIERAMDQLAVKLEMDPAELRRKNFIPPDDFPHTTATGAEYDCGEYELVLDRVLEKGGYQALRGEQATRRSRGDRLQLGIGLAVYVELTGFLSELGTCSIDEEGIVTVSTGTSPQGQGHETVFAQLVAATLGVRMDEVRLVQSDTGRTRSGMGTMGSRSLQVGGSAIAGATKEVLTKGRELAGHLLEASADDIIVVPGRGLSVAGAPGSALSWAELAQAAADPARLPEGMEPGLQGETTFETPDSTYPFGAHLALVEVDVETGLVNLKRHVSVDDAGRIANPLMAEGQIHGGIAQGVAQALFEEIGFDESGNNLTGSLVSYAIPSAADLPTFETERTETPTFRNPLGAKGIGESGAIGSTPAVWNAVVDAISHLGVDNIDMPATPQRVWQAI
ncbi:MAG: xanthine dehydrogenase family protein molybdopterin-binding subunit, partial [Solirubrobacteraceae bacterium]